MDESYSLPHIAVMDEFRQRLLRLILDRPGTLKDASEAVGMNHAYMQQFINKNKPRILPELVRRKLANYLNMSAKELEQPEFAEQQDEPAPQAFPLLKMPFAPPGPKDLPIVGEIIGGDSGEFSLNGIVNEYTWRPEQLKAVQNAYATYIVGDSMEPVAHNGQIAYVNPNKPPAISGLVVCEMHDGTAMIKTLLKRRADSITLRQYNPAKDFEVKKSAIKHLHRIILHGDAT